MIGRSLLCSTRDHPYSLRCESNSTRTKFSLLGFTLYPISLRKHTFVNLQTTMIFGRLAIIT